MTKPKQPPETPPVDPEIIEAGERVVAKREVRAAAIAFLRACDRKEVTGRAYSDAAANEEVAQTALIAAMLRNKLELVNVTYEPAGVYGRVGRLLRYDGQFIHSSTAPVSLDDPIVGPEHDA